MSQAYDNAYQQALENPESFWAEAAQAIDWYTPWSQVLDRSNAPFYKWFSDATCNTCYNAVDRHVEQGRGDQAAILYDSPITGRKSSISYRALQDQTARLAGVLRSKGVEKGDRVIIYMPIARGGAVGGGAFGCVRRFCRE